MTRQVWPPQIVDEYGQFVVKPESQHNPGMDAVEEREYKIDFGQIYLSKPTMTEADGETCVLFPKEARLRNLTRAPRPPCACRLFMGRAGVHACTAQSKPWLLPRCLPSRLHLPPFCGEYVTGSCHATCTARKVELPVPEMLQGTRLAAAWFELIP